MRSPVVRGPRIEFSEVHTSWNSGEHNGATTVVGGRDEALSGLSLTLPAGQITVLLGDHRSGKSLVALHLLGEVAPDRGRVLVGEQSLWEIPEQQRRELGASVGVLRGGTSIRESDLVASATVRENLVRQLRTSDAGNQAEAAAGDCVGYFDLTEVAEVTAGELDSAARRRLGLALALADDPEVVVIDDPGEALDFAHLEHMLEAIKGWHARTGSTVLITVHSLRVARELGQQVVVLRDGRVVAQGTPEQVLDGVVDDQSYEQRFGAGLGGVAESDPHRAQRRMRLLNLAESRRHIAFVVAFFLAAIVIIGALVFSGVLDQGSGDNGGGKAGTHGLQ